MAGNPFDYEQINFNQKKGCLFEKEFAEHMDTVTIFVRNNER
jgi:hypothetical protein